LNLSRTWRENTPTMAPFYHLCGSFCRKILAFFCFFKKNSCSFSRTL